MLFCSMHTHTESDHLFTPIILLLHTRTHIIQPPSWLPLYSEHTKAVVINSSVSWHETEQQIWSDMTLLESQRQSVLYKYKANKTLSRWHGNISNTKYGHGAGNNRRSHSVQRENEGHTTDVRQHLKESTCLHRSWHSTFSQRPECKSNASCRALGDLCLGQVISSVMRISKL